MKYTPIIIKYSTEAFKQLSEEWWELRSIYDWMMFFQKQVNTTTTREVKIDKESDEWLEFIKLYRTINNNGSYNKKLIKKYHEAIKEKPHKEMMDKLEEYKKHLELFTSKPPLQVWTFLNQKRFNDTYEVVKIDYANKWKDDMLREQKVPK